MSKLRPRAPSPGLVVAVVALVVALGGTSYAAFSLPKNSVGTKQLRNGAVTNSKINSNTFAGLQTASNSTQSSPNQAINGTTSTIGSPIQIQTKGTRRIIASAAVHAVNGVAGSGTYLVCRITIDGSAGVNDTAYASPPAGAFVDASVSPLAAAVVGGGTHTVTLSCQALGGANGGATASARVVDAALAGWAVSQ